MKRQLGWVLSAVVAGALLSVPSAQAGGPDAVCSSPPCVVADDLYAVDQDSQVMDGGFERTPAADLPGSPVWADAAGGGNAWQLQDDAALAHTGNRVAVRTGDGASASARALVNQYTGDARPGEHFDVSGWVKSSGADPTSHGGIGLDWLNKDGTLISSAQHVVPVTHAAWTFVHATLVAPSGTVAVRGLFVVTEQQIGTWYADDLVVRQATVLAGSGTTRITSPLGSALAVNPARVQQRVTGRCGSSSVLDKINEDGTVGCQSLNLAHVVDATNDRTIFTPDNHRHTLGTLTLPAGTWSITGSVRWAVNLAALAVNVELNANCELSTSTGHSSELAWANAFEPSGLIHTGGSFKQSLVAPGAFTLTKTATVALRCLGPKPKTAFIPANRFSHVEIIAIRADHLTAGKLAR